MGRGSYRPEYDNVGYGIGSIAITAAGLLVISTTGAAYHGLSYISLTTATQIVVFDNPSATTGNILDTILISSTGININRLIPIQAKYGITIAVSGTGGRGSVFFGPKG